MPPLKVMLKEILSDKKTYLRVIKRRSASTVVVPGSHALIRNPLDHTFTDEEAAALRFRSAGSDRGKARLPKWFVDEVPRRQGKGSVRNRHHISLAPSAVSALNRVCNLMSKGTFRFSRFRALAIPKRPDAGKEARLTEARLPVSQYHLLTASQKTGYRLMLKPTFPDSLVLGALASILMTLFPKRYFFRECCAYIANRGTRETVRQVMARLGKGYRVVLRLDIKSFNETVPQEKLLAVILDRAVDAGWDREDTDLLAGLMADYFSRIDEVLRTPGVGIGMGTGLTPLFTNIYLHRLDRHVREMKIPFCRFGDDLVLFFRDLPSAERVREDALNFTKAELGQEMNEGKAIIVELRPVPGEPGQSPHGFDFCPYHYHISSEGGPVIRVRDATIAKIRRRVRLLTRLPYSQSGTDEAHARRLIPGDIHTDPFTSSLARRIWKISALLGFPPKRIGQGPVRTYALAVGWPPSFLNDAASEEIRRQFKALDRYILYRLTRIARAEGRETGPESRFYQWMRDLGLRTFMDAWNRHSRPYRY